MITQLDVPIYNANILFLIETTAEEFSAFMDNKTNKDKMTDNEVMLVMKDIADISYGGFTMSLDAGGYVVFMRECHRAFYYVHEIYHVCDRILKQRGVEHTLDDEAYAYLVGWLVEEYLAIIEEHKAEIRKNKKKKTTPKTKRHEQRKKKTT